MSRKKTNKQFIKEVYDLVKDEYTFLEEYIGNKYHIKVIHNRCGHEYKVRPDHFLKGNRCTKCSKKHNNRPYKTTKQFKKEVFNIVGEEYEVLGDYINSHTKVKIRHNKCGNIIHILPSIFLNDPRCKKCYRKKNKNIKTTEQFKKEIFELVGNEYEILTMYKKSNIKIKIRHNECGYEWEIIPNSFLNGTRCPKCSNRLNTSRNIKRKTTEQFKQQVKELTNDEYIILGEYINNKIKIKVRHSKCDNIYVVTPNDFLKGTRCPYCRVSKGEEKISKYLTKYGIKFETQKEFAGLVNLRLLKFDFYLKEYHLCIEYDGEQHYKPINFCGNKKQAYENFKNQQIRDKMKNDYCKKHNIKLLRIKYTDYNKIRKIIKEELQ